MSRTASRGHLSHRPRTHLLLGWGLGLRIPALRALPSSSMTTQGMPGAIVLTPWVWVVWSQLSTITQQRECISLHPPVSQRSNQASLLFWSLKGWDMRPHQVMALFLNGAEEEAEAVPQTTTSLTRTGHLRSVLSDCMVCPLRCFLVCSVAYAAPTCF